MRCKCAASWHNLDLSVDLAVVAVTFKVLSRPYGMLIHWLGGGGVCVCVC